MSKSLSSLGRLLSLFSLFGVIAMAAPSSAQQLNFLAGATRELLSNDNSFAFVLDYSEPVSKRFSYSLVYINEGHLIDHHRDGVGMQFWLGADLSPRWTLKFGAGPYLYFDTAARQTPAGYIDDHGIGSIISLATEWKLNPRWGLQLRVNRINTPASIDTTTIALGLGYQFDTSAPTSLQNSESSSPLPRNELTAYFGRTYVNNFETQSTSAQALEYRRILSPYINWTLAAMNEGNPGPIHRNGLLTELWLMRSVLGERATLGVGLGPYLGHDRRDSRELRLSGVLSITASYRITDAVAARLTWHRVGTNYNQDTDVFLLGAGYRW